MKNSRLGRDGEFEVIRRLLERTSSHTQSDYVLTGPGDDCAVVAADGVALSSDMSVEGVHFRRDWLAWEEVGYRAAAAALSDLAAVAARPIGLLASVALPRTDEAAVLLSIMDGVAAAAHAIGAVVLGGDTSRIDGPLVIDVTAVGATAAPILRSGARAGDVLWVTGHLGAAAAAVRAWQQGREPSPAARNAYARPTPRTAEALWLAEHARPGALVDLSDGIGGDAAHIAAASGVCIVLDAARIPVADIVRDVAADDDAALRIALCGGEDYELCFTAAPGAVEAVEQEFRSRFGVPLTRVGEVREGEGVVLLSEGAEHELASYGYDHFGGTDP